MIALRSLPFLAAAAALAVALSGFGARFGAWDYRLGFGIVRWATYAALAIAAFALVALFVPRARAVSRMSLVIALVIGLAAAALPLYMLQTARALPSINDITTDTSHPPEFVAILPLRANASVPAAYPGEATAKAQHSGFPDIVTLVIADDPGAAYAAALAQARKAGWEIVASDATSGRIEAVATTPWFGFKDDVVIRIAPADRGSRIDIRSVSRIGRGDFGTNARRVRAFLSDLSR